MHRCTVFERRDDSNLEYNGVWKSLSKARRHIDARSERMKYDFLGNFEYIMNSVIKGCISKVSSFGTVCYMKVDNFGSIQI